MKMPDIVGFILGTISFTVSVYAITQGNKHDDKADLGFGVFFFLFAVFLFLISFGVI